MKKQLTILVMLILTSLPLMSQQSMFKALFIFNFAKYIEWPNQESKSEFVIGVYGNDEIISELRKLANARKIYNKTIVVKNVKSPSEVEDAQLFYIPKSKSGNISSVTEFFKGKPTLIVSEKENACTQGVAINYITLNGKMKYEINKQNILTQNLKVDQKLVSLGIEVK